MGLPEEEPFIDEQDCSHGAVKPAPAARVARLRNWRRETMLFMEFDFGSFAATFNRRFRNGLGFGVLAEEFEHVRHAAHDDAAVIQSGHFLVLVGDVL